MDDIEHKSSYVSGVKFGMLGIFYEMDDGKRYL
jgi:hypothetical protein